MTEQARPFKVWNFDRSVKKSLTAASLQELIEKGCTKLGLNQSLQPQVVLEEDGTEVDEEEYFSLLPDNTIFVFLQGDERWTRETIESAAEDETDASHFCATGDNFTDLMSSLKSDLRNILMFSPGQLQQLVDHDTSDLATVMGQSLRSVQAIKAACQRHLDEYAQTNELADILKLYHKAQSCSSSSDSTKRKRKADANL